LGENACASDAAAAHSQDECHKATDDGTLANGAADGEGARARGEDGGRRGRPIAPGLVAIGAASHGGAPNGRRTMWARRQTPGRQRQPDRMVRKVIGFGESVAVESYVDRAQWPTVVESGWWVSARRCLRQSLLVGHIGH
jgi:hypothetical protein